MNVLCGVESSIQDVEVITVTFLSQIDWLSLIHKLELPAVLLMLTVYGSCSWCKVLFWALADAYGMCLVLQSDALMQGLWWADHMSHKAKQALMVGTRAEAANRQLHLWVSRFAAWVSAAAALLAQLQTLLLGLFARHTSHLICPAIHIHVLQVVCITPWTSLATATLSCTRRVE